MYERRRGRKLIEVWGCKRAASHEEKPTVKWLALEFLATASDRAWKVYEDLTDVSDGKRRKEILLRRRNMLVFQHGNTLPMVQASHCSEAYESIIKWSCSGDEGRLLPNGKEKIWLRCVATMESLLGEIVYEDKGLMVTVLIQVHDKIQCLDLPHSKGSWSRARSLD